MKNAILCVPYDRGICKVMVFLHDSPWHYFYDRGICRIMVLHDSPRRWWYFYDRGICKVVVLREDSIFRLIFKPSTNPRHENVGRPLSIDIVVQVLPNYFPVHTAFHSCVDGLEQGPREYLFHTLLAPLGWSFPHGHTLKAFRAGMVGSKYWGSCSTDQ